MSSLNSPKQRGTLNLLGLFEALAIELLAAIDQGRVLHQSRNIAESGAPLEIKFRELFQSRLSNRFLVTHGYAFDATSACTPQCDLLISDSTLTHSIMTSPNGATYIPYTSLLVVGEIKNSARGVDNHLGQVAEVFKARSEMVGRAPHVSVEEPMSLLLIGDSTDLDLRKLKEFYEGPDDAPTFLVILDAARIIARVPNTALSLIDEKDILLPMLSRHWSRGEGFGIFRPTGQGIAGTGAVLLWLFYAVMEELELAVSQRTASIRGVYDSPWEEKQIKVIETSGKERSFASTISDLFPMRFEAKLDEVETWNAYLKR